MKNNETTYNHASRPLLFEDYKYMNKYKCATCGYIYIPEEGDAEAEIAPGTAFEIIDDSWLCPICSTKKIEFIKIEESIPNNETRA